MKLKSMICPNCGASLQVDVEQRNPICNYCGNSIHINDGVKHAQHDDAKEKGYRIKKGQQRAQAEEVGTLQQTIKMNSGHSPKKRKTWLWVLGWIFVFPVPLTVLMFRNQKLSKPLKIGIAVAAWIIYLLIVLFGGGSGSDKDTLNENNETAIVEQNKDTSTENAGNQVDTGTGADEMTDDSSESEVDQFITELNKAESINLEFKEDFIPSDKDSSHYRREFRLNAWKDSTGKSYKYGDTNVDIILSSRGAIERIYMDGTTLEQCQNMIRYASPLLDSEVSNTDIQETIDYVAEHKEANGYYYGKLGLLILGHGDRGYEFMLKLS